MPDVHNETTACSFTTALAAISFGGGWDGVPILDLQSRILTELAVPDRLLDIVLLP